MYLTRDNWQISEDKYIAVLAEQVEEDANFRNEEDEEEEPGGKRNSERKRKLKIMSTYVTIDVKL